MSECVGLKQNLFPFPHRNDSCSTVALLSSQLNRGEEEGGEEEGRDFSFLLLSHVGVRVEREKRKKKRQNGQHRINCFQTTGDKK